MSARDLTHRCLAAGFAEHGGDLQACIRILLQEHGKGAQAERRCVAICDRHVGGPTDLLDRCLGGYRAVRREVLGIDPENGPLLPIIAGMGRMIRKALFLEKRVAPVRSAVVLCCDTADWMPGLLGGAVHDQPRHSSLAVVWDGAGLAAPTGLPPRGEEILAWLRELLGPD